MEISKKITFGKADIVKILLSVVFLLLVFVPLIRMFMNIDAKSFQSVVNAPNFLSSIINSLVSTTISTVITIVLAYFTALCVERSNIKFKSLFGIIFVLPMLIPSISNGMGLIILFGNNGIISNALGVSSNLYGICGIILGSVLYAFPVAYLMFADVMKYEDASPYEAAQVLGINKLRQFTAISFPYLKKPLISIVFSTFTLIITDYGVPLMVGGKYITIPVVMYQEVIGQLNFGKGAVYGCFLLIPAAAAFVIDLLNSDKGNAGYVSKPFTLSDGKAKKLVSYTLCVVISVFVLMPIISFVILGFTDNYPINMTISFKHLFQTFKLRAGEYLINSLIIGLFTAVIGVSIAFLTAYMSARMKSKASKMLHLSSITSAAIPGIVLGISYVLVFKNMPIYGTIIILVMVNLVHFIASPYLMIYNSLSKINENIEDVGHILGISRAKMIRDIFLPQCKSTLVEMFAYFFVNCMMTISAVSFLSVPANKPISLMINQFEAQMNLEAAAIVSLMILFVNLMVKGICYFIKIKSGKIKLAR